MTETAVQDRYPDAVSHCYGCGRLNPTGCTSAASATATKRSAISSRAPTHRHPGFVYGGLIASLVDCPRWERPPRPRWPVRQPTTDRAFRHRLPERWTTCARRPRTAAGAARSGRRADRPRPWSASL